MKKLIKKLISERNRIKIRIFFNKITSVFYFGTSYHCNCCNKSFRKFKPMGRRTNAQCPYCSSLERARTLLFYLQKETNIFSKKSRLLHFAPAFALENILKKTKTLEYFSADINPNVADYEVDIVNISFPDDFFDFIICSHVLDCVPDEQKGISELCRVLKPNGLAMIMTYIELTAPQSYTKEEADTAEKLFSFQANPYMLREHGCNFEQKLIEGGFKSAEKIDFRTQLGKDICKKYLLGNSTAEWIFLCRK